MGARGTRPDASTLPLGARSTLDGLGVDWHEAFGAAAGAAVTVMDDEQARLEVMVDELCRRHACHTVIVYGSRARGDATSTSDYDLAGFHAGEESLRDARELNGRYLDAFVYPDARARAPDASLMHLRGGRVVRERDGLGTALLRALDSLFEEGPTPLTGEERALRHSWARKTLERMRRGDLEARYRRTWLLFESLETYFVLRTLWYRGPKESFLWLAEHDPQAHAAFTAALAPGASDDEVRALVDRVLDTPR